MDTGNRSTVTSTDVVVVGAGFAGLYLLQRLRGQGFSVLVLESADGVGGTWYWNRYPGARCDIMSVDYSYSFDPELEREWQWSEKYATQPEILAYANHVADKYDLRKDIRFATRVEQARWDEHARRWRVHTGTGDEISCRYYVMASGCLSLPKGIDIAGADRFKGETYYTHRWPHKGVDFTRKRVAVIGTGSSGIQSIPIIAEQAAQLTVFQRTPNFSRPARNGPAPQEKLDACRADRDTYRHAARWSALAAARGPASARPEPLPLRPPHRPPRSRLCFFPAFAHAAPPAKDQARSYAMTAGNIRNRHSGLRYFLQNSRLLVRRIPTMALNTGKHFDSISITRHSRTT